MGICRVLWPRLGDKSIEESKCSSLKELPVESFAKDTWKPGGTGGSAPLSQERKGEDLEDEGGEGRT